MCSLGKFVRASENESSVKIWFTNKSMCAMRCGGCRMEGDAMFVIASATKLMLLFGYVLYVCVCAFQLLLLCYCYTFLYFRITS